jgi:hypothetical protein
VSQIAAALSMQAKIECEGVEEPSEDLLAFQGYLQLLAPWDVVVPFADQLSAIIAEVAVSSRINRDFARLLSLVKAVTIIRHMHRRKDRDRFIATIEDYRTVYNLVAHHYASAVSGASEGVRQAVAAVAALRECSTTDPVTVSLVAKHLKIGKSSASRRINTALDNGWLLDKSEKAKGKSYDLHIGEPLPGDETGLPNPELLTECSTVPPDLGGDRGGVSGDLVISGQQDSTDAEGFDWANGVQHDDTDDVEAQWAQIMAERAARRTQ